MKSYNHNCDIASSHLLPSGNVSLTCIFGKRKFTVACIGSLKGFALVSDFQLFLYSGTGKKVCGVGDVWSVEGGL